MHEIAQAAEKLCSESGGKKCLQEKDLEEEKIGELRGFRSSSILLWTYRNRWKPEILGLIAKEWTIPHTARKKKQGGKPGAAEYSWLSIYRERDFETGERGFNPSEKGGGGGGSQKRKEKRRED